MPHSLAREWRWARRSWNCHFTFMDRIKIHKIIRSRRRTIALVVGSDATLTVRAPMLTPMDYIDELVRKKSRWVKEKIAEVNSRPQMTGKKFVNGDSVVYLG